jgi:3-hydroxybutyryl-CoA dehydrogenase
MSAAPAVEIRSVVVVGAGLMGRGIAHVAALGGCEVALVDVSNDCLDRAIAVITANMNKGVQLGKIALADMQAALTRITPTTRLQDGCAAADLAIETVPEDLALKREVFARLDEYCPPRTLLATNTSAKSVTEIAACTRRADRVIGMHFFNPAHIMRLVEIIIGLETSAETCAAAEGIARRLGKETVRVRDFPGFITSRINAIIGNEAFHMLMEGVASAADIDKALKLGLNHPMGPFELGDLLGWDTKLKVLEYLHETLGERFRPTPLMVQYVRAGRLGRKTGRCVVDSGDVNSSR